MKISESFEIVLPVFNLIDDLSKPNLMHYCLHSNLKVYFPEKINEHTVTRSFLLKVIFHKDVEKFKTLESIAKSINKFKAEKSIGGVNVSVPKVFLDELGRFESNMNTNTNSRVYSLSNSVFMKNSMQIINLSKDDRKDKRKKDLEEFMKNNNIIRNYSNLEQNNNLNVDSNNIMN